jgi:hypothetical protein
MVDKFSIPLTGKEPPPGWMKTSYPGGGFVWDNNKRMLRVIASIMEYDDDKEWLHLSMSHRRRMPTYDDLAYLKKHWAGDDRKCIMVFPPKSEHVNIHPYCLHLFCCLDGDPLPDFTFGTGSI